jgi:hypothetical protein
MAFSSDAVGFRLLRVISRGRRARLIATLSWRSPETIRQNREMKAWDGKLLGLPQCLHLIIDEVRKEV